MSEEETTNVEVEATPESEPQDLAPDANPGEAPSVCEACEG